MLGAAEGIETTPPPPEPEYTVVDSGFSQFDWFADAFVVVEASDSPATVGPIVSVMVAFDGADGNELARDTTQDVFDWPGQRRVLTHSAIIDSEEAVVAIRSAIGMVVLPSGGTSTPIEPFTVDDVSVDDGYVTFGDLSFTSPLEETTNLTFGFVCRNADGKIVGGKSSGLTGGEFAPNVATKIETPRIRVPEPVTSCDVFPAY